MSRREIHGYEVEGESMIFRVLAMDAKQDDGASHEYRIERNDGSQVGHMNFHRDIADDFEADGVSDNKSIDVNGLKAEVVIAVLLDHLEGIQDGPFSSHENEMALEKLREAQELLRKRTQRILARTDQEVVLA